MPLICRPHSRLHNARLLVHSPYRSIACRATLSTALVRLACHSMRHYVSAPSGDPSTVGCTSFTSLRRRASRGAPCLAPIDAGTTAARTCCDICGPSCGDPMQTCSATRRMDECIKHQPPIDSRRRSPAAPSSAPRPSLSDSVLSQCSGRCMQVTDIHTDRQAGRLSHVCQATIHVSQPTTRPSGHNKRHSTSPPIRDNVHHTSFSRRLVFYVAIGERMLPSSRTSAARFTRRTPLP